MAYPTFTQSGVTTVVFSRGETYESEHVYEPQQLLSYSDANTAQVCTLSAPVETFTVTFDRIPTADIDALIAFLSHALVNWAGEPFTYTDTTGLAILVRYIGKAFTRRQVTSGLFPLTLPLRKEPS